MVIRTVILLEWKLTVLAPLLLDPQISLSIPWLPGTEKFYLKVLFFERRLPLWEFSLTCVILGLRKYNITPDNIKLLVSTHGHSDHIGNNNLFLEAKHIVGFSVSFRNKYFDHSFLYGKRSNSLRFLILTMKLYQKSDYD